MQCSPPERLYQHPAVRLTVKLAGFSAFSSRASRSPACPFPGSIPGARPMATIVDLTDAVEQFHGASLKRGNRRFASWWRGFARRSAKAAWTKRPPPCAARSCPRWTTRPSRSLTACTSRLPPRPVRHSRRVAVLGGMTTTKLAMAVELALFSMGGAVEVFETDYGVYRQDILDPNSALYEQKPNTIFLATSWRDLTHRPDAASSVRDVQRLVESRSGPVVGPVADGPPASRLPDHSEQFRSPGLAAVGQPRVAAPGRLRALYQPRQSGPGRPCPAVRRDPRSGRSVGCGRPQYLGRRAALLPRQDALSAAAPGRLRLQRRIAAGGANGLDARSASCSISTTPSGAA